MDSHQSFESPKSSFAASEHEKQKSGSSTVQESGSPSVGATSVLRKEAMSTENPEGEGGVIGVLEVYIHQARDIQNICIYQKQDVYAKLCLTSNPEKTVSTQINMGGGRNPVFNESFKLEVDNFETSLKCELWMLSRVKNYLGDQLLGFISIPLSDVIIGDGRLSQEFSLSSTDLFHSHAGIVELSLFYSGATPEVISVPDPRQASSDKDILQDTEVPDSISSQMDKIEFPDPNIMNENEMMVTEYLEIQSPKVDSQVSESLDTSDTNDTRKSENVARIVNCFTSANFDPIEIPKRETPASSVSTTGSPASVSVSLSSQSFCDTPGASKCPSSDLVSPTKGKNADVVETEIETSSAPPSNTFAQSVLKYKMPEQTVVQQDIVDMYMKSMQQFTESLAKMKLPLDVGNEATNAGKEKSSTDKGIPESNTKGPRVFYGSRAFF